VILWVGSLTGSRPICQPSPSPRPRPSVARLPCDRHGVGRGLAIAMLFADAQAIGDEAADKLAIVVEEWLINVVEHGEAAPGSRIALRLERLEGAVRLTFSDRGQAFDPRAFTFEGPNMERGGGAGLALIQAWSRISDYRRRGGRNRLVLEMPLAAPP
jgi:serine/threonine-protein kinase RsbW